MHARTTTITTPCHNDDDSSSDDSGCHLDEALGEEQLHELFDNRQQSAVVNTDTLANHVPDAQDLKCISSSSSSSSSEREVRSRGAGRCYSW